MNIPASKVKSICTNSEVALVRASRKPELEELSAAEAKLLAVQARKLFDKWQSLSRTQSRDRGRQTGSSTIDPNTKMKVQIFRDARDSLEARLAKLDSTAASGKKAAARKTKKVRSQGHRTERAALRKGMSAAEGLLNAKKAKKRAATPAKRS